MLREAHLRRCAPVACMHASLREDHLDGRAPNAAARDPFQAARCPPPSRARLALGPLYRELMAHKRDPTYYSLDGFREKVAYAQRARGSAALRRKVIEQGILACTEPPLPTHVSSGPTPSLTRRAG